MILFLVSLLGVVLSMLFGAQVMQLEDPQDNALPLLFLFLAVVFAYSAVGVA